MWETIKYIGSGVTLAAFIIAVAAWIYRVKILERGRLIRLAPENNRRELVERTLEFFDIDTGGLTRDQKYDLALQQIRAKAARFKIAAIVVVIIAFLTAGVTFFAVYEVPVTITNNSNINSNHPAIPTPITNINSSSAINQTSPQGSASITPTEKPTAINPSAENRNTALQAIPDTLPRVNKLSGDNIIIPFSKYSNFAVRVTDANGNPIEGAKVAWQTDGRSYTYIGVTDRDGVSSATNMFSFSSAGTHEQTAVVVARGTATGFTQETDIEAKLGQPVKFTFTVQ